MPPALFFILKIALAILGLLWYHINLRIICSSSVKTVMEVFIGITFVDCFEECSILPILILPIQEYGVSFHFFGSSSISFINILQFSVL